MTFLSRVALGLAVGLAAHSAQAQEIRLLPPEPGSMKPKYDFSTPSGMKIEGYPLWGEKGVSVGLSRADGPQYLIDNPPAAEIVRVLSGNSAYTDHEGGVHPIKAGDVLFIAPHRANTARDAHAYSHHYIVFPAGSADETKGLPNAALLSKTLGDADFSAVATGREHVYYALPNGNRVVAWEPKGNSRSGKLPDGDAVRFVIVQSGSGTLKSASHSVAFKPGDTLLLQPGAIEWQGTAGRFIYVATRNLAE